MKEILKIDATEISRILGTVGSPLIVISELIKNSVDAAATNIIVNYDQNLNQIKIVDNGTGITIEEIKNLAKPGFSTKKLEDNVRNNRGFFFTGNKGLGLLSCFSICDEVIIVTNTFNDGMCAAKISKDGILDYEIIKDFNNINTSAGTTVTLLGVSSENLNFLTTAVELQKFRHLSTYLYNKNNIVFPQIELQVNDNAPVSIYLDADFKNMLYDITFKYSKSDKKMIFKCEAGDGKSISENKIDVTSFDLQSLKNVLLKHYGIIKTITTRTNDNADYQSYTDLEKVPSFEGRILVFDNQNAGALLKQYGAGVNIYVNQFALYNYLSGDNDWLGLADFSQRKKNTNLRPHNVFGYVNFTEFNENKEELRISNERADFIQDQIYTKLMYLIKGVIIFMVINIDVAEKNPKYKVNSINKIVIENKPNDNSNSNSNNTKNIIHEITSQKSLNNNIGDNVYEFIKNSDGDVYRPIEDNYKPKKNIQTAFSFTKNEGLIIEKLKNTNDLTNKIYHLIYEMTHLNNQTYCCSTAAIYRALLECSTRYMISKYPDKLTFEENQLRTNIVYVLNFYGNKRSMDNQVKAWRETITKRYLIESLNQYMHNGDQVDFDFMEQTWKTMKSYVIKCISE